MSIFNLKDSCRICTAPINTHFPAGCTWTKDEKGKAGFVHTACLGNKPEKVEFTSFILGNDHSCGHCRQTFAHNSYAFGHIDPRTEKISHVFHVACLQQHAEEGNKSCPSCNIPIPNSSLLNLYYSSAVERKKSNDRFQILKQSKNYLEIEALLKDPYLEIDMKHELESAIEEGNASLVRAILVNKTLSILLYETLNIAISKGNACIVKMLLDYSRQYLCSDKHHIPLDKYDILEALDDAVKNEHFSIANLLLNELLDEHTGYSIEEFQHLLFRSLSLDYPRGIDATYKIPGIFQHRSGSLDAVLIRAVEKDCGRVVKAIFEAKAPISPDAYRKVCRDALSDLESNKLSGTQLYAISKIPSLPADIKEKLIKQAKLRNSNDLLKVL